MTIVETTITMQRPPGMEETKKWSHWNAEEYHRGWTLLGA
jgi:hypothetical protein